MRLKHLLFTFALTTIFLIAGKVGWGQGSIIYTCGFESAEGFTAGTAYNNATIAYTGSSGQQWGTFFGTPSTTSPITGAQSMQMRWYTGTSTSNGYTFTNFDLPSVTKVTFNAKNTSGIDVIVSYSTDGGTSYVGAQTFSLSTTATEYTYNISATGEYTSVRLKFELTYSAAPTATSRLYLDDISVYGIVAADETAPVWSDTYPMIDGITKTSAVLKVSTDEPGKAFYQVLADGAAAPAVDDLIAAGTEIAIAAGTTEYTANLSGLTQATAYDVYVVAQDDETTPNKQAAVTKIDLLTLAASAKAINITGPEANEVFTVQTVNVEFTVDNFVLNTDGKVKYTLTPSGTGSTASGVVTASPISLTELTEDSYTIGLELVDMAEASLVPTVTASIQFSVNLEDVATPTFTPVAGTYYSTQNVEITCATADAEIRYTTNGDEPSESSSLYSTPIEVSATTTIKAKAFKAGMTPSALATAAYTIVTPTDVADIAALRASAADNTTVYRLTGEAVVSFVQTFRNQRFIQDATAGIVIDDFNNKLAKALVAGDKISNVIGTLTTNQGNLQFTPVTAGNDPISSGNTIEPVVITVTDLNTKFENYESQLVKLVDLKFSSTGNFANGTVYNFTDAGSVVGGLRTTFYDVDYITTAIPETSVTIVGILNSRTSSPAGNYITPRNLADFQSAVATLTDLKVNDVTVTDFDAATLTYSVELPFGAAVPAVAATATSTSATLDITQATVVDGGVATVLVTAQDGITTKTYTVNFTEGSPSTDASVTSTIYNVNAVEKSITGIPVTATLAEFKSNLTPATGATFEVYQADGTTVATNLATGYKVVVTAQDGIAKSTYTITLNTVLSSEANILTYSLLGVNATISSTGYTVTLTLPYGTSLDNLVATFTLSPAATAKVNDVVQVSGTTANSYSSALLYVITAEDGTIVNWTVTVTLEAPSSEASVTSTLYTVNSTDATITSVPFGTLLVDFKAAITPAANAVFEVYQPDGTTVATDLNSGYKLIVTAQDGTTKKVYTITIDEAPAVDLFFSEYIEGSSNNKAIEIYNPTGASVDLSIYSVKLSPNGDPWGTTETLTGTLASGEVFVITNAGAGAEIKAQSDLTSTVTYFNGNDAVGLFKNDVLIDVIGVPEYKPATVASWAVAGIDGATVDHTLVRRGNVVVGTTDWAASAGTNADNSQWIVNAKDDFTTLGTHSTALSSAAEITAFSFAEQVAAATIDATSGTITIEVVYGTDLTGLVSTFTVSAGAKAYVNDVLQVSGTTANNFTNEVVYKVVAEDGTIKEWTVTVTMPAQPSTAAEIVSFVLAEQTGAATINSAAGTIAIEVNSTANLAALTPTIQVSAGASISPASGAVQDFTNPVTYTVTAQDNTTTKAWTVTVTKPQVNVVTIAQIQQTTGETGDSPYINQIVETTGIVTAIYPNSGYFVQNGTGAWNGIYVYTKSATGLPSVGDEVKVTGTVTEYNSLTEIIGTTSLAITTEVLSQGNTLPAPVEVTTAAANAEQYESVLVKVSNAEVMGEPNSFNDYDVNDGSGVLVVDDRLFTLSLTVGARYNISGIIYFSNSAFRLLPRDASDIATGIDDVKWGVNLEVYPNPFTNTINFSNVEDVELITVTNLIGQRVMTVKPESSNSINTDNLIKGIYLVSFQNRDGKVIVKKMIKQ